MDHIKILKKNIRSIAVRNTPTVFTFGFIEKNLLPGVPSRILHFFTSAKLVSSFILGQYVQIIACFLIDHYFQVYADMKSVCSFCFFDLLQYNIVLPLCLAARFTRISINRGSVFVGKMRKCDLNSQGFPQISVLAEQRHAFSFPLFWYVKIFYLVYARCLMNV